MRLLVLPLYYYYNDTRGIEPQFYYLFKVPESMGHEVDFFDWVTAAKIGAKHAAGFFSDLVRSGKYDAVFIRDLPDEIRPGTLAEAQKYCPVIGWNFDDEWRWNDYSSSASDGIRGW